ncbi:unnamed protein product, partial [Pylaiella littoralis]
RRKHVVPRAVSEACETPPRRVVLRHEEGGIGRHVGGSEERTAAHPAPHDRHLDR